jgi:hypothetical protein
MAWVKSDDRLDDTSKVKRGWRRNRATIGLWYMAKTYSARHESDGLVPLEWIEDKLPDAGEREDVLSVMLDVGLVEKLPAGERKRVKISRVKKGKTIEVTVTYGPADEESYIVHDYLEFNEARVEAEERRRTDAERKTKGRGKESDVNPPDNGDLSTENPPGLQADSNGTPHGLHAESTSPDPTRPDPTLTQSINTPPTPPAGGRARDKGKWRKELTAWVRAHPATGDLLAEWAPLKTALNDAFAESPGLLATVHWLHPHQLGSEPVLGCPRGASSISPSAHRVIDGVLGTECRLIDCKCELSREQAA